MIVRLLPAAKRELALASEWYCERDSARGFLFEVSAAKERIIKHPEAWGSIAKGFRRCRVLGYPYGLIYYIDELDIVRSKSVV